MGGVIGFRNKVSDPANCNSKLRTAETSSEMRSIQ